MTYFFNISAHCVMAGWYADPSGVSKVTMNKTKYFLPNMNYSEQKKKCAPSVIYP